VRTLAELLPEEPYRGEAFDRLYMRSVLAEVFEPLGLEGEAGYRAAARVRLLITEAAANALELQWDDPDVAWLTGLHEAEGHRYFNQEAHEQMLWWLWLPRLVKLAGEEAAERPAVREMEAHVEKAARAARAAGYRLDVLLASAANEKTRAKAGEREVPMRNPAAP
jgi:hypothetical protein